jgi:hypothetical protein
MDTGARHLRVCPADRFRRYRAGARAGNKHCPGFCQSTLAGGGQGQGNISQIGTLDWTEQFRMVYRPPDEKDSRHLEQRDLIWHGYLPTRVFHGRGQID